MVRDADVDGRTEDSGGVPVSRSAAAAVAVTGWNTTMTRTTGRLMGGGYNVVCADRKRRRRLRRLRSGGSCAWRTNGLEPFWAPPDRIDVRRRTRARATASTDLLERHSTREEPDDVKIETHGM